MSKIVYFARLGFFAIIIGIIPLSLRAQQFSDSFAGSTLLTGSSALITGSNTNATMEPGEPLHADKPGGHSLWISWQAPSDGILSVSTAGSTFDTLLDAWKLEPGNDPPFERLEELAENDDYGLLKTSFVQFGVNSNQIYEIAVDGYNGATGDVSLQLTLSPSTNLQPAVILRPNSQSLRIGDPLILTLGIIPTSSHMDLRWYLNGQGISDADKPTLVIPSLQRTNLGFYSLKITLGDSSFFSSQVEVQANSEGTATVLAHDKIFDAAASGIGGSGPPTPGAAGNGVSLGYNGTQIYNTVNAVLDPSAPAICGQTNAPSYWFAYQAPVAGLMTVDTVGSDFATALAVFTYAGTLTGYDSLIPVTCDTNSGTNGLSSRVQFAAGAGSNFFVVAAGMNGARGLIHLNYSLAAGTLPQPPVLTSQPQLPPAVATHAAVSLGVVASGVGPFYYQWWKSRSRLTGRTNPTVLLSDPSSQDNGNYFVVVSNSAGAVTSAPVAVKVISNPASTLNTASNWLITAFPATRGYQYAVDFVTNSSAAGWQRLTNVFADYGGVIWLTNSTLDASNKLLRVHNP